MFSKLPSSFVMTVLSIVPLVFLFLRIAQARENERTWYWQQDHSFSSQKLTQPSELNRQQNTLNRISSARKRITCEAAAQIVAGYAFLDVKPIRCSGGSYEFAAVRGASPFSITLKATDGELLTVKKTRMQKTTLE